jgi:hypothetical protein
MTLRRLILVLAILTLAVPASSGEPHDRLGDIRCIDCHLYLPFRNMPPPPFRTDIAATCRQCHLGNDYGANDEVMLMHPIESTAPWPLPADMPLDAEGRMTCITCHYFHPRRTNFVARPEFMLRRPPGKTFCMNCHKNTIPQLTSRPDKR